MKPKKSVHYSVGIAGESSTFAPEDFRQWHKRFHAKMTGKLRGHVYGPAQCREHIAQIRRHFWEGRRLYANATFEITRTVCLAAKTLVRP